MNPTARILLRIVIPLFFFISLNSLKAQVSLTNPDLQVIIKSPTANACNMGSKTIVVNVSLHNTVAVNGDVAVSCEINGSVVATGTLKGGLLTTNGSNADVTLLPPFNFVASATPYQLKAYAKNDNDPTHGNDTAKISLSSYPSSGSGVITPANNSVCSGSAPTLTLSGFTGTITKWQFTTAADNTFSSPTDISSTSNPLVPNTITSATRYRVQVQSGYPDANACAAAFSGNVLISVDPTTVPGTVTPVGITNVCSSGNNVSMNLGSYVGSIVNWERNINGAGWISVNNAGNSNNTDVNLTQPTQYRAQVKSGVCPSSPSSSVAYTIDQAPNAGSVIGSTTVCASVNYSGNVTVTGISGTVKGWQKNTGSGWSDITPSNTSVQQGYDYVANPATTKFRAIVQNGSCIPDTSRTVATLTVDAAPVAGTINVAASQSPICKGSTSSVTLSGQIGTVQKWSYNKGAGWVDTLAGLNATAFSTPMIYTNTQITAWVTNGVCAAVSVTPVTIIVNNPSVGGTVGPNGSGCPGANSGTVNLSGTSDPVKKWQYSYDGINWTDSAYTNTSLGYTNLTDTTYYRAVVQSGVCPVAYSSFAEIDIFPLVNAGSAGPDYSICTGSGVTITLSGNNGTVQNWQTSSNGGSSWATSGVTTATFATGPIAAAGTYLYRATVQSGAACPTNSQTSLVATVRVSASAAAGTLTPDSICSGYPGKMTLQNYVGAIVEWQKSTDNDVTWTSIPGTTSPVLNIAGITQSTDYRVSVTGCGGAALVSTIAKMIVVPQSDGGVISPLNTSICGTTNSGTLTLTGKRGNIIQWESSTDGGNSYSAIVNAGPTQAYNNLQHDVQYRVKVQNSICPAVYTPTDAMISVSPSTVGGLVTINGNNSASICGFTNSGTLSLTGQVGSFVWEKTTDGITWSPTGNSTSTTQPFTNLSITTTYHAIVTSGNCPSVASSPVVINIAAPTVSGNISGVGTVCNGATGTLNLIGSTGSVLRWESSLDGTTFNTISNTGTSLPYKATQTTYYRAMVQNGNCQTDTTPTVMLNVQPATVPGTVSATTPNTVCATANTVSLNLSGNVGNVLTWQSSTNGGATWVNVGTPTTTFATSNISQTTAYRAQVLSCSPSFSPSYVINVDQAAFGGNISGAGTYCIGSSGNLDLSGNIGSITGWDYSYDGTTWFPLSNTTANQQYSNISQKTYYRSTSQSGVCGSNTSVPAIVDVSNFTTGGTVSASAATVCPGDTLNLTVSGQVGNVLRWDISSDNGNTFSPIPNTASPNVQLINPGAGIYKAFVQSCSANVYSQNDVTVNFNAASIGGNIVSPDTVLCFGGNATLKLRNKLGIIQSWENSSDNGNTWGALSNNDTVLNASHLSLTTLYKVKVKNGICKAVYSPNFKVRIDANTFSGTLTGASSPVCEGSSGTIVLKSNVGAVLNWETSFNGTSWTNQGAASGKSFPYNNINDTTYYKVVVKNGVCPADSVSAQLIVHKQTNAGTLGAPKTVCTHSSGQLSLVGYEGSVTGWEKSIDNITWTAVSNTTPSLAFFNILQNTSYRTTVKSGVCPSATSKPVKITTTSLSGGGTLDGGTSVCASGNNGALVLNGKIGVVSWWETYLNGTWKKLPATSASDTLLYSNLTKSALYRVLVHSCEDTYSSIATIHVDSVAKPGLLGGADSVCAGTNGGTLTLSNSFGNIDGWESSPDSSIWNQISNNTTTLDYNNLMSTLYFRALVSNGGCPAVTSNAQKITVFSTPVSGSVVDASYCQGSTAYILLGSYSGQIKNWQYSTNGTSGWMDIDSTTTHLIYKNQSKPGFYRAFVYNGPCVGSYSKVGHIKIDTPAVAGTINLLTNDTLCLGKNTGNLVLTGSSGKILNWESSTDNGKSWSYLQNSTNTQSFNNLVENTTFRAVLGGGVCGSVNSGEKIITLHASPIANFINSKQDNRVLFSNATLLKNINKCDYTWDFGDGTSPDTTASPKHIYDNLGDYKVVLTAKADNGCIDTVSHPLSITSLQDLLISNVMTVNGNGQNDTWYVENLEKFDYSEVHIVNRYGTEIFYASPYLNNWNGTYNGAPLPDGTYYYILKTKYKGKDTVFKGAITLFK